MANERILVIVSLVCTNLNVVPLQAYQLAQPQTGVSSRKKQRVTFWPDFLSCFKKAPRLVASQELHLAATPLCEIETTETRGRILFDKAVLERVI